MGKEKECAKELREKEVVFFLNSVKGGGKGGEGK